MRQRIQALDGLRFIAAMGVLWIHCWAIHGNPRCYVGKIDISDFLALGGNGVDLFFVISGFCMYYFYASKNNFSYHDFYRFLLKRWFRLSPAFYASVVIYIVTANVFYNARLNSINYFLHSLFYLNFIENKFIIAGHFWTLTVEWQFYFIVPFLLIYQNIIGFKKTFILIFAAIYLTAIVSVLILQNHMDLLTYTILFRSVEFGCGILSGRLLLKKDFVLSNRVAWLVAFIAVTYLGRILVSNTILSLSAEFYNLFKLAGFTLMGFGFAGILYLSVTSVKWLNLFLGNGLFKKMGRISYSFYLLHALIIPVVAQFVIQYAPDLKGISAPLVTMTISAVILYPLSLLSFNLFEKPFLSIGNLSSK
ncbi:acyltransferase [uncultured Mucilaginibacter sp.]|uniref:acyltransferase family protein n=1 Tax=uncultured Mucilaginibacter sp. TaxID=797541 RepID=UPI0025E29F2E|nr:acyltransferase [uncultured Mucilaginibacter sp.]